MELNVRKPVAWLLTLAMLFTMLPSFTFTALAADNLCEHHAEHTAECGYVEGVSDCAYHCDVCLGHDHGDEVKEEDTESAPVCDCGTDDGLIHATTCAVYVAPENPVCYCAEKCTEVNEWCDVCGFDYTACTGTDTAVQYDGGAIDLSTLTKTYLISDSGEYTFEGSGNYGIKVESGNPMIVLNDASITVGEGSAIDVASGSNATIFVLGDNTIGTTKTEYWDAPCGGIFVAEGGIVNITSNGTDNILRAHGTLAAAIGGKYDYDESYNAGSINISNVTVYAYTNNFYASAIGAAGEGTCGTINITNAVVYVYGAGDEWTSAPGIGNAWSLLDWSDTIPIVIISDSEVHTFRYNPYSDYIGYLGDESGDTYATGSINCGDGGSVKNSTIYCYTGLDATTTDKVVKYGALGGLLKEDGTCEGEHSGGTATCTTLAVCENCGASYGERGNHSFDSAGTCTGCQIKAKAKLEAFDFGLDKYVPTYYATLPEALAAVTQRTSQVEALADYDGVLELTIDFDGNGYTFSGEITVDEDATIQDGNFTGKVILNCGDIWDGTFQGEVIVKADGYIQGGTFHNTVTVETGGKITDMDSTFKGTVINNGSIYAGNFYSDVTNNGKIYRDELDVSVFYGTLTNNGTIYGGYFSGGKLINAGTVENHCSDSYDYEDGFEYVPAEGGTVTGDHNNTTEANCTSGAICSFCGEYGDKNPNNHASDIYTYTDNGDGTHGKVCTECGNVVASEPHTLTYTASGNVITATCSANCGYSETATISAENATYNGTEQTTASIAYSEGWTGGEPTVSYENNVNAGTATASITLGEATASVEFTIAKAEINIDDLVNPEFAANLVYDGTKKALVTAHGSVPGGTILYSLTYDGEYTSTIPVATEAGRYGVYWLIQGDENHEDILSPGWTQVIIAAKPGTDANVTLGEYDSVYSGTAKEPGIASVVVDGVTLTAGKDYDVSYENNVYAGTAKAVITFKGNYSGTVTETFQISKAPLTVTADDKSMTTGRDLPAFTYTITGFVHGETEDVLTTKPTVSCEANGQTAGTYDITVSGAAADNYEITHVNGTLSVADHQHAWTYTAKDDTITATCNAEGCPDAEQSITISAVGKIYDGTPVTATLNGSIDGVATPEITYTGNTNAGTHTASITIEGETASVKFTIEKATVTVTADAKSKPYGTDNPTLTYTSEGLLGDDALTGALETTATKTSSVGEYDITVGSLANSNYTIDFVGAKLTITKAAAPEIQWPTAAALTYGQKLSDSTLTSEDKNGTFAWQDGSIVPTVTNNGYVVVYTPKDDDNYDYTGITLEQTIPVTVTAADQADFSISGATTAVYGVNSIELTATGGSGTGMITWEITSGDQFASIDQNGAVTIKGAGTVTVKATKAADGNYKEKVDTHQITISKATVSASKFSYSAPADLVYNKTAKAATVTGDSAYGAITIKYYSDSSLTTVVQPINAGTYYVGITTAGGSNYEAVTAPMYVGSFTITARIVTVTADAKTMQYGDDVPTLTYTHNLIAGDSFTGSLETEATKTSDVGEYDITIGDLANSNYTISFTGAKLTITKANGPAAPTVTGSYVDNGMTYTYTVDPINGAEYSKDGTTWQDSNVFACLSAGQKYTFYARVKETKNVMAGAIGKSAEVDLSKLPGKGTVTIADWTYGEAAKAPVTNSTTGNPEDVAKRLYESTDGKGYSSANAPTNAGEYKLTVTFAATDTHNGTTASDTFTIAKATPVVDAPTNLTATYGDTLASVQLPAGWTWKDATTTEVGTVDGTNEFTVIYTKDDSGNYNTVEKTVTITVAPKVVTATVTVGENFIFNGSEQKPGVTVKDGENTIPESEYTVTYANNTNAGTATVTITDKDGGNYTVTGETTFAIAKKAASALSGVEREFMRTIATTGNEIDVEAMLPDDHGTVTYTVTSNGYTVLENVSVDANGKLVFDTKTSAAAASDTITVEVVMQNYTDVTLTVSVILNDKAPQEITGVTAQTGLIYNGEAQKGYTGTPASDYTGAYEITYTGRDNSYNSSAAPVGAGDYTVTFKIPDSDLYYSGNISINFTIGKAQATVTADDKEAYIGSRMPELTYKVSGLIGNDTISVELSCDANMYRAGDTPIVVTATDPNGNYEITTINGTLTVEYFPYIPIITPTYPPVVNSGDNGNVVVSPMKPEKGDTVTIIPDPDTGYEVDEVIVTNKNGNPVTVVDNGDGTYSFKQPSGKVNIEVTFKEIDKVCPGDKTCPMYGFTDLEMTAWYHDGVHFCIENKLMNGTSTTTFAPGATTSRAMIVTILWRLAGEPVVNYAMNFEDVDADQWYTEAIRWAASEKIVEGYGNGKFGTNDAITREQLATILYRYEQKSGGGFKGMWMFRMDYVDLADVSDWAYEAICWMNMNSIVTGRPGKILDPKGSATRAEAATMLYRYSKISDEE